MDETLCLDVLRLEDLPFLYYVGKEFLPVYLGWGIGSVMQ